MTCTKNMYRVYLWNRNLRRWVPSLWLPPEGGFHSVIKAREYVRYMRRYLPDGAFFIKYPEAIEVSE